MNAWSAVSSQIEAVAPHVEAMALIASRLVPIFFMCPLLGGPNAPLPAKLGLVLSFDIFLHFSGGIGVTGTSIQALDFAGAAARELAFGVSLGLLASLTFDAARTAGRFIDLFRGSSAEAALPLSGSREAASGDALYHLMLALAASGLAMPRVFAVLVAGFKHMPLGAWVASESAALFVVKCATTAVATGLAIGAPVAGLSLAIDAGLGFAARAAPSVNLQDFSAPVRILAGGALLWSLIGLVAERLLTLSDGMTEAMAKLASFQ